MQWTIKKVSRDIYSNNYPYLEHEHAASNDRAVILDEASIDYSEYHKSESCASRMQSSKKDIRVLTQEINFKNYETDPQIRVQLHRK